MASVAAALIKEARSRSGLTQRALAERLRVSQPEIARLESPRSNPRFGTLQRVIAACDHSLQASLEPLRAEVDESMIAANLRLSPAERLRSFGYAYRSVAGLVAKVG